MTKKEIMEKSKYILDLKENWDSYGADIIEKETWERAVEIAVLNSKGGEIDLSPCADGSIDIENKDLLINIKKGQVPVVLKL